MTTTSLLSPPPGATCTECRMGSPFYVPCGKPAIVVVNNNGEINNMCHMDADHNVRNRGAALMLAGGFMSTRDLSLLHALAESLSPAAPAFPPISWPETNAPQMPPPDNGLAVIFNTADRPIDPQNPTRFASIGPVTRDDILMKHSQVQGELAALKEKELLYRTASALILTTFSDKKEGVVNVELGQGYVAKVGLKRNYNLISRDEKINKLDAVDNVIDEMAKVGNEGSFIAERMFKWSVDISTGEYHKLEEAAKTSADAKKLLDLVNNVLEIKDATPTLEIKAPKDKK